MNMPRASVRNRFRALAVGAAILFLAGLLLSCVPLDRLAGTSTEAGNAGGKLSLANGKPAAGVSVALVARTYLPDTVAQSGADVPGSYYRTRTGPDGSFQIGGVVPGSYRVIAVGASGGAMAESILVRAGMDTVRFDEILKPLGGIRGVAKLVGSAAKVNLWVRPRATLLAPPRADTVGSFRLDSLPEGEYELVPSCFSCQPSPRVYRVKVQAGRDTLMSDTLKLFPEYFQSFPDSGALTIPSDYLPFSLGGKINRGAEYEIRPSAVSWTWNGSPMPSRDVVTKEGIEETSVLLDSALFSQGDEAGEGLLRLKLIFSDTSIAREWRVKVDATRIVFPLCLVEADQAIKVNGPVAHPMWRFHVAQSSPLATGDLSFWGIDPEEPKPNTAPLGEWVSLSLAPEDQAMLEAAGFGAPGSGRLTFVLLPDARFGGKVFRPRQDERLMDFGEIHYLDRTRLGFPDSVLPSMLPEGLILDRQRGANVKQRYRVGATGQVEEVMSPLPSISAPLVYYRSGPAAAGFAWDEPLRDAAKILAVTREGLAIRLDGSGNPLYRVPIPPPEMRALAELLSPMAGEPPALPDTAALSATGTLEYLNYQGRGRLRASGLGNVPDTVADAFQAWMVRNRIEDKAYFPLSGGMVRKYLGFRSDSDGIHYTGDTLWLDGSEDDSGLAVREYLAAGSPNRLGGDSGVFEYHLGIVGDSLVASGGSSPASSRLFGMIDGQKPLFALNGLEPIDPEFQNGIPVLGESGNVLAGRMTKNLKVSGRVILDPKIFVDGREFELGRSGIGFIYTLDGGVERAWRFGAHSGSVNGWDRQ